MQQISTKCTYSLELLEDLLKSGQRYSLHTTVIICWERPDFFNRLLQQISQAREQQHLREIPPSQHAAAEITEERDAGHNRHLEHTFLTPTLQLLASSKAIKLAYCPTVPSLRAYLSSYPPLHASDARNGSRFPRILILDLLALHHGTSEFTLQGLSRTFASAVSAALRSQSALTLTECKDINDPSNPHRGSRLWNAEVPLLSGSVKIGQEGAKWAGRSITIQKIAARLFTFEDHNDPNSRVLIEEANNHDDEEMLI
jgi:hypothetical protein